ncbi:eukaryotic aspartyl protease [Colletotrichum costaricense]|uniref:Eukaryotic aspartyl protease n=1 Tax=Colletotrichum costaricense TaxID=1209916 RepID=A0AAJ0E747_9PEZI|nr:eukaryotic aspartyl protease [Colletotrichum costaricense]KAK1540285.1 eukaryotic aspartyl protease [Colletotrichum costaricense]
MKSGIFIAFTAAGAAVSSVTALSFPRTTAGQGFIAMPVRQVRPDYGDLDKRAAIEVTLKNQQFYYSTDISIGTPAQQVTVLLDTGSSELWVNPDCATAPSASQAKQCLAAGQYNPAKSRTPAVGPIGARRLNYGDASDASTQTSAEIAYYVDTITMGAGAIVNQTFGLVTKSDGIATGIMGLAPDLKAGFEKGKPYSLILNTLADQDVIGSRAFSLDLRHSSSDSGALIYGGLDKGKFIGELLKVPMIAGIRGEPRLAATLSAVGMSLPNQPVKSYDIGAADTNVMLDSGTTLTRLHPALARPILADLKAVSDDSGYWTADCSLRTPTLANGGSDSYMTFTFGKKTIRVPLSDFILDMGPKDGQCYVGLVITTDQQILGDSMMQAGYFVFDWDNQAIHMAQAADCGKEDIITITNGENAVPSGLVGLCNGPATPDGSVAPAPGAVSSSSAPLSSATTATTTSPWLFPDAPTGSTYTNPPIPSPKFVTPSDFVFITTYPQSSSSATGNASPAPSAAITPTAATRGSGGSGSSTNTGTTTAAPTSTDPSSSSSSDSHNGASSLLGSDQVFMGLFMSVLAILVTATTF